MIERIKVKIEKDTDGGNYLSSEIYSIENIGEYVLEEVKGVLDMYRNSHAAVTAEKGKSLIEINKIIDMISKDLGMSELTVFNLKEERP